MSIQKQKAISAVNFTRYRKGDKAGHYESYFVRANHPTKPEAFWIRYTIFSPRNEPQKAIGELWGMYFNGESGQHVCAKSELPIEKALFSNTHFALDFDGSVFQSNTLKGCTRKGDNEIQWDLHFSGKADPVFLLPLSSYDMPFPKAKSLVSLPMAKFNGNLHINGKKISIKDWVGSQNHNWGERHTDYYAWGQVAGFDNFPDSFLEVASARIKLLGPVSTPFLTPLVLRHRNKEYVFNSYPQMILAKANLSYFQWDFATENDKAIIRGKIWAAKKDFVGLNYYNPPGSSKHCLNSKIARCELQFTEKGKAGRSETLQTENRAAFEILTDAKDHGITIQA